MKIGIFGGTFNPIHYGHLRAAEEAREIIGLDKILFIPSGRPPLKTEDIADSAQRFEMVRLALADNGFFEISDIECRSARKSYTVNTVDVLKTEYPGAELFFILGIDAFLDLPNWRQPETLITMTDFIIISRPGFRFLDLKESPFLKIKESVLRELDNSAKGTHSIKLKGGGVAVLLKLTRMEVSSTEIRRFIRMDRSVKYLLPPAVHFYIITKKLYKG